MDKTLVLDVGGVLASNLSPGLWEQLSYIGQCEQQRLYAAYKQEISGRLWVGEVTERQWWEWLSARGINVASELRASLIAQHLTPLPALNKLPQWAERCRIFIMSNHRTEWLQPLLAPYLPYIERLHISDQDRLSKPDPAWFQHVDQHISKPSSVRFVDDSERNLAAAAHIGWHATLADSAGNWTSEVDEWLHSHPQ